MSEFRVGDRVITRWDDLAYSRFNLPYDAVPDGEHTITEIDGDACRLAGYPNWWYPLDNMTKVDNAPAAKDDGGPAFPTAAYSHLAAGVGQQSVPVYVSLLGMSLRDYFAAKAMQGDWAAQNMEHDFQFNSDTTQDRMVLFAQMYYRMADAMLEARKK